MAARKTPTVKRLEEELRLATRRADNAEELHHRAQGKLEKYEEQEERESRQVRDMMRRDEEYRRQLEDQVVWMRRLVEQLCVPADKLKVLEEVRMNQVNIGMEPRRY